MLNFGSVYEVVVHTGGGMSEVLSALESFEITLRERISEFGLMHFHLLRMNFLHYHARH